MKKIPTILALVLSAGLLAAVYIGILYYGENIDARAPQVEIRVVPGAYLRDVQNMHTQAARLGTREIGNPAGRSGRRERGQQAQPHTHAGLPLRGPAAFAANATRLH